jgi:ferredoxin/flavodoxin
MYRAVVFFFSGTGNTWWAADRIKKRLDSHGIHADMVSMDSVDSQKANWWIKTADLILFGWPVYDNDLPDPVKCFVDSLILVEKGKHIHTFCTKAGFSADGAYVYNRQFCEKGLIIDSTAHFKMPFHLSISRLCSDLAGDKAIERVMARCGRQVDQYTERLLSGRARIRGHYTRWLGELQRLPFWFFRSRHQNSIGVDDDRCTRCGECVALCPANNIQLVSVPCFTGRCAQCLRCYAFCPASAITLYGRLHDVRSGRPYSIPDKRFKPYMLIK